LAFRCQSGCNPAARDIGNIGRISQKNPRFGAPMSQARPS